MKSILTAASMLACLFSSQASAQTGPDFDCATAWTPVPRAICASTSLSALDRQLARDYYRRVGRLSGTSRATFNAATRAWTSERDSACAPSGRADDACIERLYRQRLAAMEVADSPASRRPSYDCALARGAVERAICNSASLSALDRRLSTDFYPRRNALTGRDRETFLSGARAWIRARNTDCDQGRGRADTACVKRMYEGRLAALQAVDGQNARTAAYQLVAPMKWVQAASRVSQSEATALASRYAEAMNGRIDFKVFLADNGWFAIVAGPFYDHQLGIVRDAFSRHLPDYEHDAYANSGGGYLNAVYTANTNTSFAYTPVPAAAPTTSSRPTTSRPRSAQQPPRRSTPGSRGSTCSRRSVQERQAACWIFALGEHTCSRSLRAVAGERGVVSGALASGLCSAASQKISSGQIQRDMLAVSVFTGIADAAGAEMMNSDSGWVQAIGVVLRLGAVGTEASMAAKCAREEARNCGY